MEAEGACRLYGRSVEKTNSGISHLWERGVARAISVSANECHMDHASQSPNRTALGMWQIGWKRRSEKLQTTMEVHVYYFSDNHPLEEQC